MAIASTESLVDVLRRSFLLTRAQVDEAAALQAQFQDPASLAKEMQRRGWLTAYQVEHLLHGDPAPCCSASTSSCNRSAKAAWVRCSRPAIAS